MVNSKLVEITKQRKEELETKLEFLKTVKRDEIKTKIAEARSQGDLSENADYSSAREEQTRNEAEIAEIEEILKNAVIIEATDVTVRFVKENVTESYKISGSESNPFEGKISSESPLAKGALSHKVGETFYITTETGQDIEVVLVKKH